MRARLLKNKIPTWKFQDDRELNKVSCCSSEKYNTSIESVGISNVSDKDNSNVCLFPTFVEMLKMEVKRFYRKRKGNTTLVPCPEVVTVYYYHMGNVDLSYSNIGRHHIQRDQSVGICAFSFD